MGVVITESRTHLQLKRKLELRVLPLRWCWMRASSPAFWHWCGIETRASSFAETRASSSASWFCSDAETRASSPASWLCSDAETHFEPRVLALQWCCFRALRDQFSGNPSLRWRRGRRAVARTSKHILAFAIAFSLSFNSTLSILAWYYCLLYWKYLLCCNCFLLVS